MSIAAYFTALALMVLSSFVLRRKSLLRDAIGISLSFAALGIGLSGLPFHRQDIETSVQALIVISLLVIFTITSLLLLLNEGRKSRNNR